MYIVILLNRVRNKKPRRLRLRMMKKNTEGGRAHCDDIMFAPSIDLFRRVTYSYVDMRTMLLVL